MVNNLRILRVRAGLTQKELAAETGMAQSKISLYESLPDLSKQQIGTLKKIADVCGVKIDDIINPLPPLTPAEEMLNNADEKQQTAIRRCLEEIDRY